MKINAVHILYPFLLCCTIVYSSEERGQQALQYRTQRDLDLALRKAALHGDTSSVKRLIDKGANVNLLDISEHPGGSGSVLSTPLHLACLLWGSKDKKIETITLLLDNGARTDIRSSTDKTPLEVAEWAVSYGHADFYEAAKKLLTSSRKKCTKTTSSKQKGSS